MRPTLGIFVNEQSLPRERSEYFEYDFNAVGGQVSRISTAC